MISRVAQRQDQELVKLSSSRTRRFRLGIWMAVGLVFGLQIAVLFWLGNPPPIQYVDPTPASKFSLVTNHWDELLALQDPTLFVLPHRNNFSGVAWLKIPPQDFQPTNPSEPRLPLPLSPQQLGSTFTAFMQTNPPPSIQMDLAAGLGFIDQGPEWHPLQPLVSASTVRVEGDLAKRRLLAPLQLPAQSSQDVLRNTEVQLFVDALGNAFSPVIVQSSGNGDVDAAVLTNFAKNARFEPLKTNAQGVVPSVTMTFGKLIFEWQTVAPVPTNAPTSNP